MLIWSRKGRAAAGALAVTLFAGVFLLPLAVILLSSLSKQWNGLLPTGFTFAHFVNAFRGAAWDSLFSSLMAGSGEYSRRSSVTGDYSGYLPGGAPGADGGRQPVPAIDH